MEEIQEQILKVEGAIRSVEVKLGLPDLDVEEKRVLWKKEEQLRKKEEQLRKKEEQLRNKEEQLREKELILLKQQQPGTHLSEKLLETLVEDNRAFRKDFEVIHKDLEVLKEDLKVSRSLISLVLRGQCKPVSSHSSKQAKEYRALAINHYFGSQLPSGKVLCMITGDMYDEKDITCGHIFRQQWNSGLLRALGYTIHNPGNMIFMMRELENKFDTFNWTIFPEGPHHFKVVVLNPRLLNNPMEQYISGNAGKGLTWRELNGRNLALDGCLARPARRLCGFHALLALESARANGWINDESDLAVPDASWDSPGVDRKIINDYLVGAAEAYYDD